MMNLLTEGAQAGAAGGGMMLMLVYILIDVYKRQVTM